MRACVCLCFVFVTARHWPKTALLTVWCKTRLLGTGGQFDRSSKYVRWRSSGTSTTLAHRVLSLDCLSAGVQ